MHLCPICSYEWPGCGRCRRFSYSLCDDFRIFSWHFWLLRNILSPVHCPAKCGTMHTYSSQEEHWSFGDEVRFSHRWAPQAAPSSGNASILWTNWAKPELFLPKKQKMFSFPRHWKLIDIHFANSYNNGTNVIFLHSLSAPQCVPMKSPDCEQFKHRSPNSIQPSYGPGNFFLQKATSWSMADVLAFVCPYHAQCVHVVMCDPNCMRHKKAAHTKSDTHCEHIVRLFGK